MPTKTKADLWACRQLFFLLLKSEICMDTKKLIFDEKHLSFEICTIKLDLYLLYLSESQ